MAVSQWVYSQWLFIAVLRVEGYTTRLIRLISKSIVLVFCYRIFGYNWHGTEIVLESYNCAGMLKKMFMCIQFEKNYVGVAIDKALLEL